MRIPRLKKSMTGTEVARLIVKVLLHKPFFIGWPFSSVQGLRRGDEEDEVEETTAAFVDQRN